MIGSEYLSYKSLSNAPPWYICFPKDTVTPWKRRMTTMCRLLLRKKRSIVSSDIVILQTYDFSILYQRFCLYFASNFSIRSSKVFETTSFTFFVYQCTQVVVLIMSCTYSNHKKSIFHIYTAIIGLGDTMQFYTLKKKVFFP